MFFFFLLSLDARAGSVNPSVTEMLSSLIRTLPRYFRPPTSTLPGNIVFPPFKCDTTMLDNLPRTATPSNLPAQVICDDEDVNCCRRGDGSADGSGSGSGMCVGSGDEGSGEGSGDNPDSPESPDHTHDTKPATSQPETRGPPLPDPAVITRGPSTPRPRPGATGPTRRSTASQLVQPVTLLSLGLLACVTLLFR